MFLYDSDHCLLDRCSLIFNCTSLCYNVDILNPTTKEQQIKQRLTCTLIRSSLSSPVFSFILFCSNNLINIHLFLNGLRQFLELYVGPS